MKAVYKTEELSVTCKVSFQNKFEKLVHLVGFIIRKFLLYLLVLPYPVAALLHLNPFLSSSFPDKLFSAAMSPYICAIKSRRLRRAWHVACMGEKRNACWILMGKPDGKKKIGRLHCR
jgi:hypothetical protein